jgi:hypothetical protein
MNNSASSSDSIVSGGSTDGSCADLYAVIEGRARPMNTTSSFRKPPPSLFLEEGLAGREQDIKKNVQRRQALDNSLVSTSALTQQLRDLVVNHTDAPLPKAGRGSGETATKKTSGRSQSRRSLDSLDTCPLVGDNAPPALTLQTSTTKTCLVEDTGASFLEIGHSTDSKTTKGRGASGRVQRIKSLDSSLPRVLGNTALVQAQQQQFNELVDDGTPPENDHNCSPSFSIVEKPTRSCSSMARQEQNPSVRSTAAATSSRGLKSISSERHQRPQQRSVVLQRSGPEKLTIVKRSAQNLNDAEKEMPMKLGGPLSVCQKRDQSPRNSSSQRSNRRHVHNRVEYEKKNSQPRKVRRRHTAPHCPQEDTSKKNGGSLLFSLLTTTRPSRALERAQSVRSLRTERVLSSDVASSTTPTRLSLPEKTNTKALLQKRKTANRQLAQHLDRLFNHHDKDCECLRVKHKLYACDF